MKNNKFMLAIKIVLIILCVVIILSLFFAIGMNINGGNKTSDLLYDIIKSSIQAIITTVLIGTITKIIADRLIKIKKNDSKLKKFGIEEIKTGKSDYLDIIEFFGNKILNDFPTEIGMCFITGNDFLKTFRPNIIEALKHGTVIKILVAGYNENNNRNSDFLERAENICPQAIDSYWIQLSKSTIPIVNDIKKEINEKNYSGQIELVFYKDEYRFNYRYSIYNKKKNNKDIPLFKMWLNVQPTLKNALNLSVALKGDCLITDGVQTENNLLFLQYQSFVKLWDIYKI